jgi:hypothetical protein
MRKANEVRKEEKEKREKAPKKIWAPLCRNERWNPVP